MVVAWYQDGTESRDRYSTMATVQGTKSRSLFESFLKNAKNGDDYSAPKEGLFFRKAQRGGAWWYRYTRTTSLEDGQVVRQRTKIKIGDSSMYPADAMDEAEVLRKQNTAGLDPMRLREVRAAELQAKHGELVGTEQRRLGVFFEEIYTPHVQKYSNAPKEQLGIIRREFGHLFDRDMASIRAEDIDRWEKNESTRKKTRATLDRNYGAFKAMLNYAAGKSKKYPLRANDCRRVLDENPIRDVSLSPKSTEDRIQIRASAEKAKQKRNLLTAAQLGQIENALLQFAENLRRKRRDRIKGGNSGLPSLDGVVYPHWFIPFCHIARLTGMRPGDIRRLRWQDIGVDTRSGRAALFYEPHKTLHHGNSLQVGFPITPELKKVLDTWGSQYGHPKSGLMFPSSRIENRAMDKKAYIKHWNVVRELAKLPDQVQFYCFRHNFISRQVSKGQPVLEIADLVGHKNAAMIQEHYFIADMEAKAKWLA